MKRLLFALVFLAPFALAQFIGRAPFYVPAGAAAPSSRAVTYGGNTVSTHVTSTNTVTFNSPSIPADSANRVFIISVTHYRSAGNSTVQTLTVAGTGATYIGRQIDGSTVFSTELWGYIGPATGASSCVVTMAASCDDIVSACEVFYNAHQTTAWGGYQDTTTTNLTSFAVTVSSQTNDLVTDAWSSWSALANMTVGAGQTWVGHVSHDGSGNQDLATSTEAGAASVTMSWSTTSNDRRYCQCAVAVKAAVP